MGPTVPRARFTDRGSPGEPGPALVRPRRRRLHRLPRVAHRAERRVLPLRIYAVRAAAGAEAFVDAVTLVAEGEAPPPPRAVGDPALDLRSATRVWVRDERTRRRVEAMG